MYRPPLDDIKFVLTHVADLEEIASLSGYEHVDLETAFGALDEAGRFFSDVVAPTNRAGDTVGSVWNSDGTVTTPPGFKEAYDRYVAAGWGAIKGPIEYGGHGFPGVVGLAVQEMLTASNMALSLCPMLTSSAVLAVARHGTDEQKSAYLERLLTGEWAGTMVLTEPHAGSDLGDIATKAIENDDGSWSLTGQKIFISWGEHDLTENIIHLVLAKAPGGPSGTKGISMFVVPKFHIDGAGAIGERNAVECISIEHKLGIRGSPTCVLSFDGARAWLVGEVHQGMQYMFTMMNDARLAVALEGLAISERAYQQAAEFALQRRQGSAVGAPKTDSSPIAAHPDVQRMLMTMEANIEAMRGLMYATAAAIDRAAHGTTEADRTAAEGRAALLTPLAKGWGTDLGVELTSIGVQVHGGMGYVEETGAAQHFRDARIAPIYEGTNGIQAIDLVTRKLSMDGGGLVDKFLQEIESLSNELADGGDGFLAIRNALNHGVDALRAAIDYLTSRSDPNDALAGASPFLRMFGAIAGGYYLAQMALAAYRIGGDDAFHRKKVATATFYATQIMPAATALLSAVTAGVGQLRSVAVDTVGD